MCLRGGTIMNIQNIPEKLKQNALWCVWKSGKIPCNPHTGANAKSNLPETFADFETAYNAWKKGCWCHGNQYEGLGINICNGFSAIDIDHCIDEKGRLSDMANDIIEKMGSYTEISPSGTGIHIIFTIHGFQYDKEKYYINNQKMGLEVYVSGSTNKFITITGDTINDYGIVDNPPKLQEILERYMFKLQSSTPNIHSESISINSEEDYLQVGLKKDKKLISYWNGERPLKSESENDMGFMEKLLYWMNGNTDKAINAFLSSPYTSQKDKKHQKKIKRPDYLLKLAKAAMPESFAAQSHAEYQARQQKKRKQVSLQQENNCNLNILSAQELQKTDLPPVKYLIEDILPQGTSILTAASKIGKSWFVLDMGLQIAAGQNFLNKKTEPIGILYLALEDSNRRLKDRMNKILDYNLAPSNLHLLVEAPNIENGLLEKLDNIIKENPEIKLIIIDTLQKIRGQALPRENAYQQDYRELGMIKKFADQNQVSIFLVHHNRKLKDDDDPFNMISGTNGIMGAVDTIFMITKKSRNSQEAVLHLTGRDVLQSDTVIQFNKTTCRWEVIGKKDEIDKEEYEHNSIVRIIKRLINNSNASWKGTASSLKKEGEKFNICLRETAQEIGYKIKDLQSSLYEYDRIRYNPISNGNSGKRHHFYIDKRIETIPLQLDEPIENCDEDDDYDIEF